ncbi:MAG TPA: nitrate- and nitrite sensing domain-containing protein [Actinomycetota bacterium]|nr:nitrate- and nitrite sensing domain-containing protein [Actinomycetota bacterium]
MALTLLTSLGIGANLAVKVEAEHLRQEAAFTKNLSRLVHELQAERDLSAGWVSGDRASEPSWPRKATLDDQQSHVNEALKAFGNDTQALENDGSAFYRQAQKAQAGFSGLNELRQKVENNSPGTTAEEVLDSYSDLIGNLLAVNFEIARNADNHTLTRSVAAFVAMARLKEAASQERGFLHAVTAAREFAPGQSQRLSELVGAQESWRSQFNVAATPEQHDALDQTLQRADSQQATEFRESLLGTSPGQLTTTTTPNQPITIDPADWYRASTARIELLNGVEEDLAGDVDAAAAAVEAGGSRRALIYTVILTVLLWLTVGLVLLMARSMVQPLRTLTDTANEVADHQLPGLVEQLQHAKDPRDLDVVVEPVPVTSRDEIGQVSAAFNSVHRTAIEVATEQAALRKSIGDMFLNLARRSQSLIDRQLELIDDLERTEADPDALDNLFKLDHLATRMRRNAEDLIVLSGAEPARRWSQPVPLVDVVRAALAEVEDYNRVELLPIDDIGVAGQAVSDVVHLLAELIENATSFSPPGTKVQVAGQQVSNGYVLEIEDRGLGMTDDELVEANERLANPPMIDFALSRMLGLYVVARLAQRYNIKVQLRHSWYGGITALVLLPPTVAVRAPMPEAIEAPARRGPAELVPSTKPVEPVAEEGGEHLPIFEAARSDWFEDSVRGDHLPLRRHAAQQPNGRAAEPTGNGAGTLTGAGATRLPAPDQSGPGPGDGGGPNGPGPNGPSPDAARTDAARAEAMRVEAMRIETARMEAARGEAAREEAARTELTREATRPGDGDGAGGPVADRPRTARPEAAEAGGAPAAAASAAEAPAAPTARTRGDGSGTRARTGPLPTRTPGASGPPPGGAKPFAPATPPGGGEPLAPATPPSPGRPSRRTGADRVRADRARADRAGTDRAPAGQPAAAAVQGAAPAPADGGAATSAKLQAASVQTTKAGLPRRVPRANLAPGMVAARTAATGASPEPAGSSQPPSSAARSPEEVRSMLSSYRSGLERGRMAAGEDADRGGDAHSSSRSDDDDATQ